MPIIGRFPKTAFKHIPASIDFNATIGDNTLHLRNSIGGYDCTIDWGDGTTAEAPIDGGNIIHNYKKSGIYNIKISGNKFGSFCAANQSGKEKHLAFYSAGRWENDTMWAFDRMFYGCSNLKTLSTGALKYRRRAYNFSYAFSGCTSLTTIPADLFKNADLKSHNNFGSCFFSCTSLTTIPVDLFRYNVTTWSFRSCFLSCSSLKTIPPDLFRYNTEASDYSSCFANCNNLTLRNDIFGTDYSTRFNGEAIQLGNCFYRASFLGTKGTAPELWKFEGLTSSLKTGCFGGAGNSTASLLNYNDIPADWK